MHRVADRAWTDPTREVLPYRPLLRRDIDTMPELQSLDAEEREVLKAVSAVFPFRVNRYVVENLIDWNRVPDDPMYQLTFPQRGMLETDELERMLELVRRDAPRAELQAAAREIQLSKNPHPAGQAVLNVPADDRGQLAGIQHKYRETVLFFPTQGQTCHAYCSYCFRWPQFVGLEDLKFASKEADRLAHYVESHPEVTDVLLTGGDPMVMKTDKIAAYVEPLLGIDHLIHIRFGTKALAYWPYRFVEGQDADALLRLFERVRRRGKQIAIMAHMSHPRELETSVAREAVRRLRSAGCNVRSQAPLIRRVNDDPSIWTRMWTEQLRQGVVPYYMFVERDTGPRNYFEVPLERAWQVYREALQPMGGLGRTVRGPSMSATPGKVCVDGVAEVAGRKVFVLQFLQGRDPDWIKRPFFAEYDPDATWLSDLRPAFGEERFFWQDGMDALRDDPQTPLWQRDESMLV